MQIIKRDMLSPTVLIDHGSGGLATQELINGIFLSQLSNPVLREMEDSAIIELNGSHIAFSTDSYVVDPIFFPGGDIGSLAVHGTINDLAMRGAKPLFLSLAVILEEGFPMSDLERVAASIRSAAEKAQVKIVTGDTKVVPKGKGDKIYVNTSGIGIVPDGVNVSASCAQPGDLILLSGTVADHGITILVERSGLTVTEQFESDSAPLHWVVQALIDNMADSVHTLRDPTRGGVATALCEIAQASDVGMEIYEEKIPVKPSVRSACEMLGMDPLYIANEGKFLAVVSEEKALEALRIMRMFDVAGDSAIIGRVTDASPSRVTLITSIGGKRVIEPLSGEVLPRIC